MGTKRCIKIWVVMIAVIASFSLWAATAYAYEDSLKAYWTLDEFNKNDNFNTGSLSNRWNPYDYGSNGSLVATNNNVTLTGSHRGIYSGYTLSGDFDVQVDYSNLSLGGNTGTKTVTMFAWSNDFVSQDYTIRAKSGANNVYYQQDYNGTTWTFGSTVATSDATGKLRITRVGSTITGYEWNGTSWVALPQPASPAGWSTPTYIGVQANSDNGEIVSASFDNLRVNNQTAASATGSNSGTAVGATSVAGKFAGTNALNFNGTSDYVSVPDSDSLSFGNGTTDTPLTFSAWVKMTDASNVDIFNKGDASTLEYRFRVNGTDNLVLALYGQDSSNYLRKISTDTLTSYQGQWVNLIATYDGSRTSAGIQLYVNGTAFGAPEVPGGSYIAMRNTSTSAKIGALPESSIYANSAIDDLGTWSRVLSAAEISYLGSGSGHTTEQMETTLNSWNAGTADWNTAGSWRAGQVAGAIAGGTTNVFIDNGGTATVGSTPANAVSGITLSSATGSGTLRLNGGTLTANGNITDGGGTSTLSISGGTLAGNWSTAAVDNFSMSSGTLGGSGTLTAPTYELSGGTVSANLGAGTKTVSTGTMTLSGAFGSGDVNINSGTLKLGAANRISDSSAMTANGTFDVNGFSETIGSLAGGGSVTSGAAGAVTLTAGGNNSSTDFAGVIQNGSGTVGFTKTGSGTLNFLNRNTYTGATTVSGGTLLGGCLNAFGTTSGSALVMNGGTFDLGGYDQNFASLEGTTGTIKTSTYGSLATLTIGSNGNTTSYGGIIQNGTTGTVGLTKVGSGTLTLSGTNTYTGLTSVSAGELDLNNASANAISGNLTVSGGTAKLLRANQIADAKSLVVSGGTFNIQGYSDSVAGVQLTSGTISGSGGTLTSTSAFDMRAGSVSAILGGTTGLNKTTGGTVTLSGINTYSGTTLVSNGTLALTGSGSIANSSLINVASGAIFDTSGLAGGFTLGSAQTIKGSGSVTGDLTIGSNSIIAPGNSPGTTTVNGDFTLLGTYEAELGGTGAGEYDKILVYGGDVVLGSGSTIKLIPWLGFTPTIGNTFTLIDWDDGKSFVDNGFTLDTSLFGPSDKWTFAQSGSSFQGTYTGGVPEPSSMAVSGIALGLLGLIKKMRNKKRV